MPLLLPADQQAVTMGRHALWDWLARQSYGALNQTDRAVLVMQFGLPSLSWTDTGRSNEMQFEHFVEALETLPPEDCGPLLEVIGLLGCLKGGMPITNRNSLEKLFAFFSPNGVSVPAAAFKTFAKDHASHIWAAIEPEGDLTMNQFMQILANGETVAEAAKKDGLELLFHGLDTNGDGILSDTEREGLLFCMRLKKLSWVDLNADGHMSFDEFQLMLKSLPANQLKDIQSLASALALFTQPECVSTLDDEAMECLYDFFRGENQVVTSKDIASFARRCGVWTPLNGLEGGEWRLNEFRRAVMQGISRLRPISPIAGTLP